VYRFIYREYKTKVSSLGLYRILFATYVLVIVLPQNLWVSNFPNSFFNPPISLTIFFTGFPGAQFFLAANCLSILFAVWLLFGYRSGIASNGLALSWFVNNCWAYSFGKINHDILLILMLPMMQLAGWGKAYSMDAQRNPAGGEEETKAWPVALMALMVALGMMTAALAKFLTWWLDPHSHAVLAHLLLNEFVTGRSSWFTQQMLRIHSGMFWEVFDVSTVLVEAAFLATVGWRPAFRVVCALACFFHLGIALTMQIAYVANLIAYAAFFDWSFLETRMGNRLTAWNWALGKLSGAWLLAFSAIIASVYLGLGENPLRILFPAEWDPPGVVLCAVGAIIAALFLTGKIRIYASRHRMRASRSTTAL
jgi:hypothetical protein